MTDISNTDAPAKPKAPTRKSQASDPPANREVERLTQEDFAAQEAVQAEEGAIVISSRFDDLLGDVERDTVAWTAKNVGDTIAGVVKWCEEIPWRSSNGSGVVNVSVIDTNPDDPKAPLVRVAWIGTVLAGEYRRQNVQPRDQVALRRGAEVESANGTYTNWATRVKKAAGNLTLAEVEAQANAAARRASADPFDQR